MFSRSPRALEFLPNSFANPLARRWLQWRERTLAMATKELRQGNFGITVEDGIVLVDWWAPCRTSSRATSSSAPSYFCTHPRASMPATACASCSKPKPSRSIDWARRSWCAARAASRGWPTTSSSSPRVAIRSRHPCLGPTRPTFSDYGRCQTWIACTLTSKATNLALPWWSEAASSVSKWPRH